MKLSGIQRVHAHLFPHGIAYRAADPGADPGEIQLLLGHPSLAMGAALQAQRPSQGAGSWQSPPLEPTVLTIGSVPHYSPFRRKVVASASPSFSPSHFAGRAKQGTIGN